MRHETLQHDRGARRVIRDVAVELRPVVDAAHAVAVPADIGFGDQREIEAGFGERAQRTIDIAGLIFLARHCV